MTEQTATETPGSEAPSEQIKSMEEIVALCKRRGFVFPASEIYGGLNGFWDYGPLGIELKNNLRDAWWRDMVTCPPLHPKTGEPLQIVGVDTAIIQNPKVWEASGHVAGFNDPLVEDTATNQRFRADYLQGLYSLDDKKKAEADFDFRFGDEFFKMHRWASLPKRTVIGASPTEAVSLLLDDKGLRQVLGIRSIEVVDQFDGVKGGHPCLLVDFGAGCERVVMASAYLPVQSHAQLVPSPFSAETHVLMEPRQFNLMFPTNVGAVDSVEAYLRPETAQGIFLNFKNVVDTSRVKVPFGIAQIGKSFRNEVTPRNFIFRSREFEQMEMEWFCHPDEAREWYDFWVDARLNWWKSLGISGDTLQRRDHDADELAHYSTACADVEYRYPFTAPGFGELEGIAHRGCFDLSKHQEHSGKDLTYFDQDLQVRLQNEGVDKEEVKQRSRYLPHVIEPAAGLTRGMLVLLCEAFTPTPDRAGSKYVMNFHPRMAPIKAAIFPLVAKDGMPEKAHALYMQLRAKYTVQMDVKQSIGKRYARMDEAGTPYCFTIDGQTMEDDTVTVRHRDTAQQERINISQVETFLAERI